MAEYHEVRSLAELRKQGEHERAEECSGSRPCAVPAVASPSTWCPWLAPPRTPHPCRSPPGTRAGAHAGDDDRRGSALNWGPFPCRGATVAGGHRRRRS